MRDNRCQIDGWLVIDKPYDIGSTAVVSKIKWSLSPSKIGHAGTLDPLATGVLPIALGRATKLIPYVMDGSKTYDFQITWGCETDTDDAAGDVVKTSKERPDEVSVRAVLPFFTGIIEQLPPAYSALKINGRRAYDLARAGEAVQLKPRPVRIERLELLRFGRENADFRVVCGKGTYVRSLGRDIGRRLGCLGYITVLRRVACGPFSIKDAVSLSEFDVKQEAGAAGILSMDTVAGVLPAVCVAAETARRLSCGQRVRLADVVEAGGIEEGAIVRLIGGERLIGLGRIERGVIHPYRMF